MNSTRQTKTSRSTSACGSRGTSAVAMASGNCLRSSLCWLTGTRQMLLRLTTPMTRKCKRQLESIDRQHFLDDPIQGTWLDLEVETESPKRITMRMVRRGRLLTGETTDCLADFRFVVPRGERCGVAVSDELEADDPRYPRPYVEAADEKVLGRRPSRGMLIKLAARSSQIIVLGGGFFHEFPGLSHHGRLVRCQQQEDAYAHGF